MYAYPRMLRALYSRFALVTSPENYSRSASLRARYFRFRKITRAPLRFALVTSPENYSRSASLRARPRPESYSRSANCAVAVMRCVRACFVKLPFPVNRFSHKSHFMHFSFHAVLCCVVCTVATEMLATQPVRAVVTSALLL